MTISQCIIVKNEEENIKKALSWGKNIVDEQIVVDTGSTDRTVEIAKEMGATVLHFPWKNDFAAAKNFAIQKAYGDWIMFLDADEYFEERDTAKIVEYLRVIDSMKPEKGEEKPSVVMTSWINIDKNHKIINVSKQQRIFRNRKYIRYVGRIHEYIDDMRGKGLVIADLTEELNIYHTGYDQEIYEKTKKLERNIEIIQQILDEKPDCADMQLYMAESQSAKGNAKVAMEYVMKAVKNRDNSLEGEKLLVAHQMELYQSLLVKDSMNISKDDVMQMYDVAVKLDATYPDFDIALAFWYQEWGEPSKVVLHLLQALEKADKCANLTYSRVTEFIGPIYQLLTKNCYELQEWQGTVEYGSQYLQLNPYDEEVLGIMLRVFLDIGKEPSDNIMNYILKLYDVHRGKDIKFLKSVAGKIENQELKEKIKQLTY